MIKNVKIVIIYAFKSNFISSLPKRYSKDLSHLVVMYYTQGHLCPGMCSTSLLTHFDGNYTLEILVWAMSLYHYEGPEGWEEPGIERKPSFT